MEDSPEPALINELLRECDGGNTAIVVPNHVWHAGILDRLHHFDALRSVHRKRLLAQDHLSRLRGGDGDVPVHVVWAGNINHVYVVTRNELAPIRFTRLIAPPFRESVDLGSVAAANSFEDGLVFEVEKVANFAKGVGVGAAHEAVTNQADVKGFHR